MSEEKKCTHTHSQHPETHQRAEALGWVPARYAKGLHADAHEVLHGGTLGLTRVLLPYCALFRVHQGLAQVVLAQGVSDHMQQQEEDKQRPSPSLHVHGKVGGQGKGTVEGRWKGAQKGMGVGGLNRVQVPSGTKSN